MNRLQIILFHLIFGGLVAIAGGAVVFLLVLKFYTVEAHYNNDYVTILPFAIGATIALYVYVTRFVLK